MSTTNTHLESFSLKFSSIPIEFLFGKHAIYITISKMIQLQNVTLITRANQAQDITGVTHILLLHVDTLKTYFFDEC